MTFEEETRAMFSVLVEKLNRIELNTATRTVQPAPETAQGVVDAALKKLATALNGLTESRKMLEGLKRDR